MADFRGVTRNINMKFGQFRRLADKVLKRTIITLDNEVDSRICVINSARSIDVIE